MFFRKGCECSLPRKRLSENPRECEWIGGFEAGYLHSSFPDGAGVKNLPADAGDAGSIPGWGRSPGVGHGSPLQCSRLENPMDRGAWGYSPWGHRESDRTE